MLALLLTLATGQVIYPGGVQGSSDAVISPGVSPPSFLLSALPAPSAPSTIAPQIGPAFSCSRASTGTYQTSATALASAAQNTCRVDYRGLLVEESRTNLVLQSGQMQATPWAVDPTSGGNKPLVVGNHAVAPDGTTTAAQITYPAVSTTIDSIAYQSITASAVSYAESFWVETDTGTGTIWGHYDQTAAGPTAHALFSLTTAWARFSLLATGTAATNYITLGVDGRTLTGEIPFSAIAIESWGAQLEQGPFATSYIPTTTTAVTRAADQIDVGAITLSAHPSFSATVNLEGLPAAEVVALQAYNSASDRWGVDVTATGAISCTYYNGASFSGLSAATLTPGTASRISCSYDGTNIKVCVAGACTNSARSFTPSSTFSHFYLGSFTGSSSFLNGFLSYICAGRRSSGSGACQ